MKSLIQWTLKRYISHYKKVIDGDKKFVLMEIIIQATNDQPQETFLKYWKEIQPLLQKDFEIHEYTIFYWSCFEKLDESEFWTITPWLRVLWDSSNIK
jgi:hypothetical protein